MRAILRFTKTAWSDLVLALRYHLNLPYVLNMEIIQSPPKPKQTYVFIHGIGNTLHSWDPVFKQMPDDVRIIGIDLLGFGGSPKPRRVVFNAKMQARSVLRTLLKIPMTKRPVIVGHSLGSIVAIEMARKYPHLFKKLFLCSPPLYKPEDEERSRFISQERLLRNLYRTLRKYPGQLEKVAPFAVRAGIANPSLTVTDDTIAAYIGSLESSIINQSALQDVRGLKLPIQIIYGSLDPLVVGAYLRELATECRNIEARKIIAGHEVTGRYARVVADMVVQARTG